MVTALRVSLFVAVVIAASSARAGVVFDDGLVHQISDDTHAGCMVEVRSGPGGATTTLDVLPGAFVDSGRDASALIVSAGENGVVNVLGGSVTGRTAGFVGQNAGPHTISGGIIQGGNWSVVLRDGACSMAGGMITGPIPAWFQQGSVIEIDGATLDGDGAALVTGDAQVYIRSGILRSRRFYAITTADVSTTLVEGGSVTGIEAGGASLVIVTGGAITNPAGRNDAVSTRRGTVHIRGGTIVSDSGPELVTWQGEIHIHGSGFDHPDGPLPVTGVGRVHGTLEDGTGFSWSYSNVNGGRILLMEETIEAEHRTWSAIKSTHQ